MRPIESQYVVSRSLEVIVLGCGQLSECAQNFWPVIQKILVVDHVIERVFVLFRLTVKLRKPESDNPQDAGAGGKVPPTGVTPPAAGAPTPPAQPPASSGGKP